VKTHCAHGHPLTPDNLRGGKRLAEGKRECLTCHRLQQERRSRANGIEPRSKATHCQNGHDLTVPENQRPNGKGCAVCHRENQKMRYHEDPERHRAASSEYQKRHRPARNEYHRKWRAGNERERERAREAKRLRRAGVTREAAAYREILVCDPCSYCGGPSNGTDHIVPIAAGVDNDWTNLTATCGPCNSIKRTDSLLIALLR
jgi:hypothetical protein